MWDSLDGAKTEVIWGLIKMCFKGRKGLASLVGGDLLNFENLLPEALLKQVENYNSENGVIEYKKFNLQDQVFDATNDIWEKLGQILQLHIIKNTKNNDLKFLNLSTVFGFLRDKKFNVYDYIVKLEKLYSHVSDALLDALVNRFEFEKNTLANESMKRTYTQIIKNLAMHLFKTEEANISIITKTENTKGNSENKDIANKINEINEINIISDEKDINSKKNLDENRYKHRDIERCCQQIINDIVDVVLKKFGSLYGFIYEFNKAVVPRRDGSKILGILNFVIDFIFDKDKISGKSIASLLIASLNQIDWSATLKLTNAQKKEISRWVSIFCMMVFTCTKFLDCETNIYRKTSWLSGTTPELKITSKLITNLKQIMSDKNFIKLANDFGIDKKNLSKIKSFLDNISNLKVEDCFCISYLAAEMPDPERNLNLIFDLAKKFHEEYEQPTVQIILNVKKNKIKTIDKDKDVFDIMNKLDEVKKVDNELAKSADIELKTFIWVFKNRLQFLFEKTNSLLCKSEANLDDLLVCSYTLSNLLKFVCDDRFGGAIIKEISDTDISKNRKKDQFSLAEKWVSVFENFNKIFDKYKITDINSIFFDMNVDQTKDSRDTVGNKYGIHIYLKNIFDVLEYFNKRKIKLCPKKNDSVFDQFKNNLEQFNKRMKKAVDNAKKTWNTLKFTPVKKKCCDCAIAEHIAENYKSFDNIWMNFRVFYEESLDKDGKIISMKQDDLFDYFQKLWTWLDFTFGTYNFYTKLSLNKCDDDYCFYCKKFDNISLVINYIYENRVALKKSDSNDDLLVALCSVKKLLDKVAVHADKKITLKDLKKRLSYIIYYFRYLKDREKERDENESLKSNVEKNQINEINDNQNKMFDGTKNAIKINEENQQTDKIVSTKNNLDVTTFENKNIIHDQINIGVNNGNNKIPNEQSKKQLDNNIVNGDNIIDVKDNKKCETSEIDKNKNEIKNDIVIENQNSKNRTIENKNNDYQQKDEVDLKCVETGLVLYKPNQFLKFDDKEVCFNKTKTLILSVIANRKNKIIKDLVFNKNQSEEVKQTKDKAYTDIENKIKDNGGNDINNKNENENVEIEYNKEININVISKNNEKQNRVGTNNIDDRDKIENNNTVNPKAEIKNSNENKEIIIDKKSEKQNDNNERENQDSTYTDKIDTKKIEDINSINDGENNDKSNNKKQQPILKIPQESSGNSRYISKQIVSKNVKNENKINDKKVDTDKVDINKTDENQNTINLLEKSIVQNSIMLDSLVKIPNEDLSSGCYISKQIINKIEGNNNVSDINLIKSKETETRKNSITYNINVNLIQNIIMPGFPASNKINLNSKLDNKMKIDKINKNESQTMTCDENINRNNLNEQISSNNTGNDLKNQKLNQNPNQKNLCFVFIFVGIVFFIIAALFLTNIIWTWFVMNFIAQLAIMIFSVFFACVCIFKHKSLRQKLSSWHKQKYQNQMIPKIDVSYDQHKKMDDRETNSDVSPKSEETDRVCPFCFFWK